MDTNVLLSEFAVLFVRKEFRDRFIHEWTRKPQELHKRICHDIEKVFEPKYRLKTSPFHDSDECLVLGWRADITTTPWLEAKKELSKGAGGYLVIGRKTQGFYAETEAYPVVPYASGR